MSFAGIAAAAAGSIISGSMQKSAANKAAKSAEFNPYNVSGGVGSATFGNGTASYQLSPEYQALRNQFLGSAQGTMGAYNAYDPQQAAQQLYGQLGQLSAPGEAQARSSMENRLFAQGRLGTTGGQQQFGNLLQAQNLAGVGREVQSFNMAQDVQNQLLGRAMQSAQGGAAIDQMGQGLIGMGSDLGGRQSSAGAYAAQFPWQAAQNQSDATSAFFSNIASKVGSAQTPQPQYGPMAGGYLTGPQLNSPYTPQYGIY